VKALRLNELKSPLQIEDIPAPKANTDQVVVNLHAAAFNRRDFWITKGLYPGVELPVTLGSDGAGIVETTGEEVIINPGLNWGDRQAAQSLDFSILGMPTNGTFAEQVVVPAIQVHPKPDHLNWAEAATLPLAGVTAFRAVVQQGQLASDETILISGVGGGVATFALQFAVALGAKVLVTSSSPDKIEKAKSLGALAGYNYQEDDWVEQLTTDHGPVDLIIDSAGGDGYANLIDVAAFGGRIINNGATTGPPKQLDLFKVFWKQLHLIGSTMGSPADFEAMLKLVGEKKIHPAMDRILPFDQANSAFDSFAAHDQFGKIALQISQE
jgi:zinc-binding alcohol dehydrogenase/oxidoreductase